LEWFERIFKNSNEFTDVKAINARISIIKCVHVWTGVRIDANWYGHISVAKTILLRSYIKTSEKLLLMNLILRSWVTHPLSKFRKLSAYAMGMLQLSWAQQEDTLYLPTINDILLEEFMEGPWCIKFKPLDQIYFYPSLKELLYKFFKFISEFDFFYNVLATNTGIAIPKWQFIKVEYLHSSQYLLKDAIQSQHNISLNTFQHITTMLVQDPLELSHNVTANMTYFDILSLQMRFKQLAQLCSSANTDTKLSVILESSYHIEELVQIPIPFFSYPYIKEYLECCCDYDHSYDKIVHYWYEHTLIAIKKVFNDILHCNKLSMDKNTTTTTTTDDNKHDVTYKYLCRFPLYDLKLRVFTKSQKVFGSTSKSFPIFACFKISILYRSLHAVQ
jgi:hypothetical protein